MPLKRILDLRKKTSEEHVQDQKDKISDEDGRQLATEEAVGGSDEAKVKEEMEVRDKDSDKDHSKSVRTARATKKERKGKHLALVETIAKKATPTAGAKKRSIRKR